MCIIIAKPRGTETPSKKVIKMGYKKNGDGAGIAFTDYERGVAIKKDFNSFNEYWDFIDRRINKDLAAVFHMRIRTSGKTDKGGRHPFPISNNENLLRKNTVIADNAVAHNGTFPDFSLSDTDLNDSQIMTKRILFPNRDKIVNSAFRFLLNSYIGDNNSKLTILNKKGLMMFGSWKEKNGLLFSNTLSVPFKKINKIKNIGGSIIKDKENLEEFDTYVKTMYSNINRSNRRKYRGFRYNKNINPVKVEFNNFEQLFSMRDKLPKTIFNGSSRFKSVCDSCGTKDYIYNMYAAWDKDEYDEHGNLKEFYILCPECLMGSPTS